MEILDITVMTEIVLQIHMTQNVTMMIDPVNFIEQYCLVNGRSIKLTDYQKKFIKWINLLKWEKEYQNK